MSKPIIILADIDEKYLEPLEMKFLEEWNDSIELEVITDRQYFELHFMEPQSADVLVIDEELYSADLQRHNIKNIFVLTDRMDSENSYGVDVIRVFKYTSIKEIHNQIVSSSSGFFEAVTLRAKQSSVILVSSASGGVGKTTIAMGLSGNFVKNYKRVLYIDAERVNQFQFFLQNKAALPNNMMMEFAKKESDIYERIKHAIRNEMFDYLPPFSAAISSLGIDYSVYREIIRAAKLSKEYDVIIVDTDNIFDTERAALIDLADRVVMVTNQSAMSVAAMNNLLKNLNYHDTDKYYFVCNNFSNEKSNALISTEQKAVFMVNEYVRHIAYIDSMGIMDLANNTDIQKLSALIG